jgi:pSer/pThr/pTyr-binding forkhead associated (FHA) protein
MGQRGVAYVLRGTDAASHSIERELVEGELTIGRAPESGLILDESHVSRHHATIRVRSGEVFVEDAGSSNGTFVNGERVSSTELTVGDAITIGSTTLQLASPAAAVAPPTMVMSAEGTVVYQATQVIPALSPPPPPAAPPPAAAPAVVVRERGVVDDDMLRAPLLSEADLRANDVEVTVVPCAAVGAGLGSFVWVDTLRVSGVPSAAIAAIGDGDRPYARYQRLCRNSQIPPHERLRSNSDSCPDNIWGFPSYAAREAWGDLRGGRIGHAFRLYRQLFNEPVLDDTYTPRSGDVFASIDREAARIGWQNIYRFGRVRAVRKTQEGRIVVIASVSDDQRRRHYAVSAQFVHFSPGYPSLQFLPDLAEYRDKHQDRTRIVNAYEQHDHVYENLKSSGGVVMLRGRGIVASRILQRLYEERGRGANLTVIHLHRSREVEGHRWGRSKREVVNEWEFQPFNWPKGAWTGRHRAAMEAASDEERQRLLGLWGGTTTADRRDWKRIVREGLRDGWYRPEYGVVKDMTPAADGRVTTHVSNALAGGGLLELTTDYVIDCTGLIASPDRSPVIDDMMTTYALPKNPYGRIAVSNDFEIEGMRHGSARMYAAGAVTLGGPFAAVDSFLGLQYAGLRAVSAMQRESPGTIRSLSGLYSWGQWLRWARRREP